MPADRPIHLLLVEDDEQQAELATRHLERAGLRCTWRRVENEPDLRSALIEFHPELILSDFTMPQFGGLDALRIARELRPEIPFLFLSGTIGEERAVEALHRGAVDYVLKDNLTRLAPAVERALREAADRADKRRQEAQIARLTRVLRMLSGVNDMLVRINQRTALFDEACRLAVSAGGYTTAVVVMKRPPGRVPSPIAWTGIDDQVTESLRALLEDSAARDTSIVGRVLKKGSVFVCSDTAHLNTTANISTVLLAAGSRSLVALPLSIDKTPVGVLVLAARDVGSISDEELSMLREVAGNLSFALQYLQKDSTVRLLSHFDPKTGLAKRPLFCERLSRLLGNAANGGARHGAAVLDIEGLSHLNDALGRNTGDLLLQHVAARLRQRFPNTEQLAHFDGGTFAVMRDITARPEDKLLPALHEHAVALFSEPFLIEGRAIPVAIRSGFALHPEDGRDAETLVRNAEAALRSARSAGERQFHYSAEKHQEAIARLALEHKLRLALERRQFQLHYQPKVSVRTRRIEGVEALIRWHDPESGLVSPAAFLPLLESTGLIVDVGEWVLQQAAGDSQHWQRLGLPGLRIAVNISPVQMRRDDFVSRFLEIVRPCVGPFTGLDIEITEGVLSENADAEVKRLTSLRSTGVRVAIDDIGTGYSSLSRLAALPIDALKIDRAFTQRLPDDPVGRTLVATIIALARGFDLSVTAEGVETVEQLGALWELGCDQSQGFLHSTPVPRDEFAALVIHGRDGHTLPAERAREPTKP